MKESCENARQIFLEGVKGVLPEKLINDLVSLRGSLLRIGYCSYDLTKYHNIYVVGAGKATPAMAHYIEAVIGNRISGGYIVTKYGYSCKLKYITVAEAGHPVPDLNSYKAADEILSLLSGTGENDLVICIWSGGGSALLADHPENSSREDMAVLNEKLVRCGADIKEINSVRKHLSRIKGGQLAMRIRPAESVTILLSDVIGDPPDIIASGPTVPDNSTFADAMGVIEKYSLTGELPEQLVNYIREGIEGLRPETPKADDPVFRKSPLFIAGNNKLALLSAMEKAEKLGYDTYIITDSLQGDTDNACSFIIETINNYRNNTSLKKPLCLLFGGETTVKVAGNGTGGRNQHLALVTAFRIRDIPGITFLSAGSDGSDGETDAAGAVVHSGTIPEAINAGKDPETFLRNFDSWNFFRTTGGLIKTGPTLTNVMDIMIVIIDN